MVNWVVCEDKFKEKPKNKTQIEKNDDLFQIYNSFQDLPADYQGSIKASMFPDDVQKMRDIYKLQYTARILPHDQNTGGFYLALLRKKAHLNTSKGKNNFEENKSDQIPEEFKPNDSKIIGEDLKQNPSKIESIEEEKDEQSQIKNQLIIPKPLKEKNEKGYVKGKEPRPKKEIWINLESDIWDWAKNFYGIINEDLIKSLLISQNQGDKKVLLITPGVKKLLDFDKNGNFNRSNLLLSFTLNSINK